MLFTLLVDMFFVAAPLMATTRSRFNKEELSRMDPSKLNAATATLQAFYEQFITVPTSAMLGFSGNDWAHLIVAIILGYRLSLPIAECRSYDSTQARRTLQFGSFIDKLCDEPEIEAGGITPSPGLQTNNCRAFKVILRTLKIKFDKKAATADAKARAKAPEEQEEASRREAHGCPVLDGSLDDYIASWDGTGSLSIPASHHPSLTMEGSFSYATSQTGTSSDPSFDPMVAMDGANVGDKPLVFHDLWSTMTMGWTEGEEAGVLGLDLGKMA
jgi:hypothetical protein